MRIVLFTPITIQVEAAKRLGYHVTSVWHRFEGPNFFEAIIQDVKRLSDEFIQDDLLSGSGWIDRLKAIFNRYPETILIPGVPDEFLPAFLKTASELNRLPNPLSTYEFFKSKLQLRHLLQDDPELGVRYTSVETKADFVALMQNPLPPSILKPACSSGSKNISFIESADDLRSVYEKWSESPEPFGLVLEECFEGPQFSVEAISKDGRHAILGITEKFPVLPPTYIENGGVFPAQISEELAGEIISTVTRFLNRAGFQNGATHTEVIATSSGVKIVESNARVGGLIPFLIEGAHGVDVNEFYLEYLAGKRDTYRPYKNGVAILGIVKFESGRILEAIENLDEIKQHPYVIKMNIWARMGQKLPRPLNNEQRHGYIVVWGCDADQARRRLDFIFQKLQPIYHEESCLT